MRKKMLPPIYPQHAPHVMWRLLSTEPVELLILAEPDTAAADIAVYALADSAAVAYWQAMNGRLSLADLAAQHADEAALDDLQGLCVELAGLGLITLHTAPAGTAEDRAQNASPAESPQSLKWCRPIDLNEYTNNDLVALGTFVGGQDNVSSLWSCGSQAGGIGNGSSSGSCRPGAGYGWFNAGYIGTPCP